MGSGGAYLIVGASGAIGSAVAAQLAAPGVSLGLHYCRNAAAVSSLREQLESVGAACEVLQSDLADETDCRDLVARFRARFNPISGIALCAGTVPWHAWSTLNTHAWQQALFEHCIAPYTIAVEAALSMNAGGRIVFLSSIAPKYGGSPQSLHYAAGKGALEAAMRGLSRFLATRRINVNGVRAGFVDTPQQRIGRTPEEITQRIAKIPAGRGGTPAEVASAVVYLLSDHASFITGELITVAGGD